MKFTDIRKYDHNCDKLDPSGEHKPYVSNDVSSLEERQPALKRHPAGHCQPPELTQSKSHSFSVNIAVHCEYPSSTVLVQIVLVRRKHMALYSVHLNRHLPAASSQDARIDVQHCAVSGCQIHIDILDGTEGCCVQLESVDVCGASFLLVSFPEAFQ
ncbi:hypothetical protein X801_07832 [Opisthorchis viverrini]|uniref:Uncharacterized protein n=1 Tax=Opisthorchis viverrini TaxID=6198 RepID=A0A1S8WPJ6_OPIVI|nr:hypothetical protein X801_07832 [Opisthorchis viverrini]